MAAPIQAGAEALMMDAKDHVATAIKDLRPGETIIYRVAGESYSLEIMEAIPFGHKVAIVLISEGTHVRKYGEVIGRATENIAPGFHVHVHNVEGIRGRGDQAQAAGGGKA
ncbi:UxaA family hydrolase [Paenibacillus sp. J2TS4]|uniref:UxaA family hydrolase n=1 Tax=Paenibacillus sp. J2TS4 TaxID=2807194 RepID=UPI001BD1913D|nr:UxaA family hydrolase [Paenibacillus sp. J2TS4]